MSCLGSLVFLWRRRIYGGSCKTSPFVMLPTVKIGGSLVRNAGFSAFTCLLSSRWFSCGVAVSMGKLHTLHFALYTPHSTIYTLDSTLYTLHSSLHTLHSPLYTPHSTLYTFHSTLCTPHSTLYCTLHTPHFILYTPHSTLRTLHS